MKPRVLLAGLAVAAVALTPFAPAVAQAVQATLTRNIDEPGRNPYESTIVFNTTVNGIPQNRCEVSACVLAFRRVPEGKRLVMLNITGLMRVNNELRVIALASDAGTSPHLTFIPVKPEQYTQDIVVGARSIYVFNENISGYAEAGQTPLFSAGGLNAFLSANQLSQVKLSGYLVDASDVQSN